RVVRHDAQLPSLVLTDSNSTPSIILVTIYQGKAMSPRGKTMDPLMTATKVALVTGAGKHRVGWHVTDALAGRGYAVAIHYRSSAAEAKETVEQLRGRGVVAAAFQAD